MRYGVKAGQGRDSGTVVIDALIAAACVLLFVGLIAWECCR